jgi:hypothetical protein
MPDVREILQLAKADAPAARHSVDDIVAAGRRRRRRAVGQWLGGAGVVAAAVATATLLTVSNLALSGGRSTSTAMLPAAIPPAPAAPAASPPFTFTFAGYQVDNYRVLPPDEVTLAYQTAGIILDNPTANPRSQYAGTLTVYQPGMFDPDEYRTGTPLTVQGREAFQADLSGPVLGAWNNDVYATPSLAPGTPTADRSALAWQYAPDAWAVINSEIQGAAFPPADEVKIAERFTVTNGAPTVAKVPFRAGYLPAGFTLQSVSGQSMTAENRGMVTFVYSLPQPTTKMSAARSLEHDGKVTSVVLSILWVDTPPPDAVKRTSRCNPGQHWCVTTLPGGEFYLATEDPSATLSDAELLRVADGLTFANIKDTSTWYPIA